MDKWNRPFPGEGRGRGVRIREGRKNDVSPAQNGDALYLFTTSTIVLYKYTNIPE